MGETVQSSLLDCRMNSADSISWVEDPHPPDLFPDKKLFYTFKLGALAQHLAEKIVKKIVVNCNINQLHVTIRKRKRKKYFHISNIKKEKKHVKSIL